MCAIVDILRLVSERKTLILPTFTCWRRCNIKWVGQLKVDLSKLQYPDGETVLVFSNVSVHAACEDQLESLKICFISYIKTLLNLILCYDFAIRSASHLTRRFHFFIGNHMLELISSKYWCKCQIKYSFQL